MAVTRDDIWLFIFYQQSILIPPEDKSFFLPLSLMGLEHFKAVVLVILGKNSCNDLKLSTFQVERETGPEWTVFKMPYV